ncbi:MAG: hypothetical protein ACE5G9_07005 [Nitrospinales bacterium]
MGKKISTIGCLLILWIVAVVAETYAHGGHSKPPAKETTVEDAAPAGDAGGFYAVEGEATGSPSDASPFSRTRLFSGGEDHGGMEMQSGPATPEKMQHDKHKVKLAEHKWVTSSQKGYGVAVGITVLAGLVFGILSIKRKRE